MILWLSLDLDLSLCLNCLNSYSISIACSNLMIGDVYSSCLETGKFDLFYYCWRLFIVRFRSKILLYCSSCLLSKYFVQWSSC